MISNCNIARTRLVLSKDNFRVMGDVEGRARATYVFGIADMYRNARLAGARASASDGRFPGGENKFAPLSASSYLCPVPHVRRLQTM